MKEECSTLRFAAGGVALTVISSLAYLVE